jgi:hypothetical protein
VHKFETLHRAPQARVQGREFCTQNGATFLLFYEFNRANSGLCANSVQGGTKSRMHICIYLPIEVWRYGIAYVQNRVQNRSNFCTLFACKTRVRAIKWVEQYNTIALWRVQECRRHECSLQSVILILLHCHMWAVWIPLELTVDPKPHIACSTLHHKFELFIYSMQQFINFAKLVRLLQSS